MWLRQYGLIMNADRYFAAEKLLDQLLGPRSPQRAYEYFGSQYRIYIEGSEMFTPKPEAVVDIERLMKEQPPMDAPEDEQWWRALEQAVLKLYEGEVLLRAGVVTEQHLADRGSHWKNLP